jgi:S1-C subfamily serine protease
MATKPPAKPATPVQRRLFTSLKATYAKLPSWQTATIATLSAFLIAFNVAFTTDPAVRERELKETHAKANVFRIRIAGRGGGTGFLINDKAYGTVVLTNKHICDMDQDVPGTMFILDQNNRMYFSTVRRKATLTDLCIIEPPQEFLAKYGGLTLAEKGTEAQENETLFVYGHPNLRPLTASSGAFVNYSWIPADWMQPTLMIPALFVGRADIVIQPGNSGSPVLNSDGEVVGIVFAHEGEKFIALFIPLENIRSFLEGGM